MSNEDLMPFARAQAAQRALNDPTPPEPTKQRPEDQVLPTPNEYPSVHAQVAADLMERERIGVSRYGTPLQPFNGRDADQDLYEELLDAAAYMKQRMIEKAAARSRGGAFPNMMQAWVWLRDTSGCTSNTPIDSASVVLGLAESKVRNSQEGQALLAAAVEMLTEAGVLE